MASDKKAEQSYQDWEKPLFDAWKEKGYFGRTPGVRQERCKHLHHRYSSAERNRYAAYGSCLKRHHSRHLHPSCSHAGLSGPLDPRH